MKCLYVGGTINQFSFNAFLNGIPLEQAACCEWVRKWEVPAPYKGEMIEVCLDLPGEGLLEIIIKSGNNSDVYRRSIVDTSDFKFNGRYLKDAEGMYFSVGEFTPI